MLKRAGGSLGYDLIVANVVGETREQLKKRPCQVLPSDLRVDIPATGLYTYPDIVVVCGDARPEDQFFDTPRQRRSGRPPAGGARRSGGGR